MRETAVAVHPGQGAVGIGRARGCAQEIHHHLAPVGQAQAGPIPADLVGAELAAADLVVHPRFTGHGVFGVGQP